MEPVNRQGGAIRQKRRRGVLEGKKKKRVGPERRKSGIKVGKRNLGGKSSGDHKREKDANKGEPQVAGSCKKRNRVCLQKRARFLLLQQ